MDHYAQIPGFDNEDYQNFMEIVMYKWNLPANMANNADLYFLRHWTARDIFVSLSDLGIRMFGVTFIPIFNKGAKHVYNQELAVNTDAKFWLSFRSIRYPVGTDIKIPGRPGNLRSYVIIQAEDKTR